MQICCENFNQTEQIPEKPTINTESNNEGLFNYDNVACGTRNDE